MADDKKEIPIINSIDSVESKANVLTRRPIDEETKEWSPDLDTALPIDGFEIPNFKAWIGWNGFQLDRKTREGHDGFDFAAYLTTDNRILLGLPEDIKICAVADGIVRQVLDTPEAVGGGYGVMVNVEHGANDSGMFSQYIHVKPTVETGVAVKKGDVIGELYKDDGNEEGRLVHLHLSLSSGWGARGTSIMGGSMHIRADDPGLIDTSIYRYRANPQGSANFTVPDLPSIKPEYAHFKRVKVNS